ncbi:hypothetical protein BC830DRAFT_930474 [Chytriomyces sp. MP71]|nr:hypothetical protein BC830DRAFT_930474 [Chytriomyces sp. MP71]
MNALLTNLPNLRILSLSACASISSLHFAFQSPQDTKAKPCPIESIDMRGIFSLVDVNQTLAVIFKTYRATLQHIYIPGHFLSGSDGFSALMNVRPHLPLHTLHIDTPTNLTDISLLYLARGHTADLRILNLAQAAHLTSPSLAAFLSHSPRLAHVDLSHIPNVDDHVLQQLAASCTALRSVRVRGCVRVSDVGLWALTSRFEASLEELALDYSSVTAHGVKKALQGSGRLRGWGGATSGEGALRMLSLSNCQGVISSDVHLLARLLWWEENCLSAVGTKGVEQGAAAVGGAPGMTVVTAMARAATQRPTQSHPIAPHRAVTTNFGDSMSGRMTDLGQSRNASPSLNPKLTLKSVLVRGGGSPSAGDRRPHSVASSHGGVGMFSRNSTFGGLVGGVPMGSGGGSRNSRMSGFDGAMQGQSDGIRLDPTLIEFKTSKNVDRIRDL